MEHGKICVRHRESRTTLVRSESPSAILGDLLLLRAPHKAVLQSQVLRVLPTTAHPPTPRSRERLHLRESQGQNCRFMPCTAKCIRRRELQCLRATHIATLKCSFRSAPGHHLDIALLKILWGSMFSRSQCLRECVLHTIHHIMRGHRPGASPLQKPCTSRTRVTTSLSLGRARHALEGGPLQGQSNSQRSDQQTLE